MVPKGEEILINGKFYVSVGRASDLSGYHRDYLGRLCRSGKLDGRKISNNWVVSQDDVRKLVAKNFKNNFKQNVYDIVNLSAKKSEDDISIPREADQYADSWDSSLFSSGSNDPAVLPAKKAKSPVINFWRPGWEVFKKSALVLGASIAAIIILYRFPLPVGAGMDTMRLQAERAANYLKTGIFPDNIHFVLSGFNLSAASWPYINLPVPAFPGQENFYSFAQGVSDFVDSTHESGREILVSAKDGVIAASNKITSSITSYLNRVLDKTRGIAVFVKNRFSSITQKPSAPPPAGETPAVTPVARESSAPSVPVQLTSAELTQLKNIVVADLTGKGLIVERTIEKPTIIEKTLERIISGVSSQDLDEKLSILNNKILSQIVDLKNQLAARTQENFSAIALTNKIDQLTGTKLYNVTVSGMAGLTDSDIPNDITASNYLPLTGGTLTGALTGTSLTLSGAFNASNGLLTFGNASGSQLTATNSVYLATTGGFVGIGTTTPWGLLSVNPNGISGPSFVIGSSTATNFIVTNGGNIGIGTTSPSSKFSVVGNSYFGSGFSPNSTLVAAAPYATVASGSANFGPSSGETSLDFIDFGHILRIRENGTVSRIKIYMPSITGVTGFYFKVWRASGSNFDLVGSSANLASELVAGQVNTITLPAGIAVNEGDYVGARVEYSSASAQILYATTTQNTTLGETGAFLYYVTNATPSSTGYNWTGQASVTNSAVLIEADMTAPVFVTIGDSITSGLTGTGSFADNYQLSTNVASSYAFKLGHALGYTYQNMGIGGQTTSQMSARFTADVVNLSPKFVVIMGGVNDILAGTPNTSIVANITSMLDQAHTAGIVPVVIGVMPFRGYSLATNAMLQQRDLLNTSLRTLVTNATYNGYYVDTDSYVGQYYAGGDSNNKWQLQPIYDKGDHIHPNPAGQARIAQAVSDAINQVNVQSATTFGNLTINGDISFAGDTPRFLRSNRNALYNSSGSDLTISAGGASVGSVDQSGGNLILQSGVGTGVGTSSILFYNTVAGTTGATDTPTTLALALAGGNVGVGTSSPWGLLSVNPNGISGPSFVIGSSTATSFIVTNGGNVGIGTTEPTAKLHFLDTTALTTFTGAHTEGIRISQSNAISNDFALLGFSSGQSGYNGKNLAQIGGRFTSSGSNLYFGTSNNYTTGITNTAMVIDSTGSVGIGTSTPYAKLTVWGSGTTTNRALEIVNNASTTLLTVLDNGNVGIATTSPYAKLSVSGEVVAAYFTATTSTASQLPYASSTAITVSDTASTTNLVVSNVSTLKDFTATNSTTTNATTTNFAVLATASSTDLIISGNATLSKFTPNSVIFSSTGGLLSQNNASFSWNNSATRLSFPYASSTSLTASGGAWLATDGGMVGIGTTSPFAKLSVAGSGFFNDALTASNIMATGTLNALGLSTLSGGFISNASSSIGAGFQVAGAFNASSTSFFNGLLTFGNASGTQLTTTNSTYLATTGGFVGIGTTTPAYPLDVYGFINTNKYSGYKQDGNTVLYASTTNFSVAVGASGAANWMSATSSPFYSTAVGYGALNIAPTNGLALSNSAFGFQALALNTAGHHNTATGFNALVYNTTGSYNTALGNQAGSGDGVIVDQRSVIDDYVTFLGFRAGRDASIASTTVLTNITAIGKNARVAQSNSMILGGTGSDAVNVGIGTTTPWSKLSIQDTYGSQNLLFDIASSTSAAYATSSLLRVLANGNVGVGTTSPAQLFSVHGNSLFGSADASVFNIRSGTWQFTSGATTTVTMNNGINFDANTFVIDPKANNVGIGTPTPSQKLDVNGSSLLGSLTSGVSGGGYYTRIGGASVFDGAAYYGSFGRFILNSDANFSSAARRYLITNSLDIAKFAIIRSVDAVTDPSLGTNGVISSGTADFVITNTGAVGIGTTAPGKTLDVAGTAALRGLANNGTANYVCSVAATGEIATSSTACAPSSLRFKENINNLSYGISDVMNLRPVSFNYRPDFMPTEWNRKRIGFIAEEMANVIPEVVGYDQEGLPASIDYPTLTSLLAKSIQQVATVVNMSAASTTLSSIYIDSVGNVGIGTSTPLYKMQVAGDIAATGFINVSTREAKKDITFLGETDYDAALEKIKTTEVATYNYISDTATDGGAHRLGLIAEQAPVEILSPDHRGVDLYKMTAFLWSGVKAQEKKIEELTSRLEKVEGILAAVDLSNVGSSTPISVGSFSLDGVLEILKSAGIYISNGVAQVQKLMATQVYADEVYTRQLCIDDVCINKTQLQALLKNAGLLETAQTTGQAGTTVSSNTAASSTQASPQTSDTTASAMPTATSSAVIIDPTPAPVSATDVPVTDSSTASTTNTTVSSVEQPLTF